MRKLGLKITKTLNEWHVLVRDTSWGLLKLVGIYWTEIIHNFCNTILFNALSQAKVPPPLPFYPPSTTPCPELDHCGAQRGATIS